MLSLSVLKAFVRCDKIYTPPPPNVSLLTVLHAPYGRKGIFLISRNSLSIHSWDLLLVSWIAHYDRGGCLGPVSLYTVAQVLCPLA